MESSSRIFKIDARIGCSILKLYLDRDRLKISARVHSSKKTAEGVNLVEKILAWINERGRVSMGARQAKGCKTIDN